MITDEDKDTTEWEDLGLSETIVKSVRDLKWEKPTKIQRDSIPLALQGKDIIGLSQTGSGKTGAFTLPILDFLLKKPHALFALILAPTR